MQNRIQSEVCKLTKKHRLIILFTSDVTYEKCKWLAYTSGVLSGADIQKSRSSDIVMVAGKYNNNNNNNNNLY